MGDCRLTTGMPRDEMGEWEHRVNYLQSPRILLSLGRSCSVLVGCLQSPLSRLRRTQRRGQPPIHDFMRSKYESDTETIWFLTLSRRKELSLVDPRNYGGPSFSSATIEFVQKGLTRRLPEDQELRDSITLAALIRDPFQ